MKILLYASLPGVQVSARRNISSRLRFLGLVAKTFRDSSTLKGRT